MSLTVEKCLQAWTNSFRQLNVKADIVFFGDSLTYFGDFSSIFPNKVVCNLGLRGDTIQGMKDRVEQVKLLGPNVVYLMTGVNNVVICTPEEFGNLYKELVDTIQEALPKVRIIIQSLLPVNDVDFNISCNNKQIIACNKEIASIAINNNLKYVNLFDLYVKNNILPKECTIDGIHLVKMQYHKWLNAL